MGDQDDERARTEDEATEDLELRDDDAGKIAGGADAAGKTVQRADGSLDAGIHFKYDLKAQKEG
jgi:hypothetical protein